ncbi:MAG TPA: hypothetical protein VIV40_24825 [Kofleriaceae bacterium]
MSALSVFALAPAHATPIAGPRSIGSFFSSDDGASHAIIAKTNGDVVEAYWWDNGGLGSSAIAHFDNIAAVSGFYSSWDAYRHAIVALHNGQVWDVRFNPCCGIVPTLLVDLSGWGDLKSISAWTDPQRRTNIAFLSHWGTSNVLGIYQQGGTTATSTNLVKFYPNDSAIDVAGHHEVWNATSMVTVATGSPSRLEQFTWADSQTPDWNDPVNPGSNLPWATQFPGPNRPAETVVSLAATDQWCYYGCAFGGVEQIELLTTSNVQQTYNVNNGGAQLFDDWNFVYGPQVRSVSGPFLSNGVGRNTLVMMSNGDVWDMTTKATTNPPQWTYRKIGTF